MPRATTVCRFPDRLYRQEDWRRFRPEHAATHLATNGTLIPQSHSWCMSANIEGKPRAFLPYLDPEGVGGYRKHCDEIAQNGYPGFAIT